MSNLAIRPAVKEDLDEIFFLLVEMASALPEARKDINHNICF